MTTEKSGLRERKKAQSRLAISNVATKMFIERGFDDVTVAEVAAAADVSVATIFNYFETKEELFFDREGEVIAAQRRFILERKPGESITSVLRREFLAAIDAGLPQLMAHGASFLRTIEGSSALRARLRLGFEKAEALLAETVAEETETAAGDPTPQIVAAILVAIQRTLIESAGAAALRGDAVAPTKRRLRKACERAFVLLEGGMRGYGKKKAAAGAGR
ncbi:MAG TPA: TetR family transcriptional regulator [Polyangiaceae bacterium]|jgi:AcrR family transcriptional regulator|nr:TetR family transcriptional regulator [Polyangiaceae bacterium]